MHNKLSRLRRSRRTKGITLVELAVAILVLTIGTVAALRATDQSQRVIGGETPRLMARLAARNRIEELKIFSTRAELPKQVILGPYNIQLEVSHKTTAAGLVQSVVTARSDSGEGAQLIAYFTPGQPQ
ncbi:MAG: type IV pilus modification PilV family protein [Pelagimonas sp.]|uniref:type IV pilus modification PilV family protein n=1 Tax=Pelagimonas sp. TaxID=2073170 RepID=UPI003D6C490F